MLNISLSQPIQYKYIPSIKNVHILRHNCVGFKKNRFKCPVLGLIWQGHSCTGCNGSLSIYFFPSFFLWLWYKSQLRDNPWVPFCCSHKTSLSLKALPHILSFLPLFICEAMWIATGLASKERSSSFLVFALATLNYSVTVSWGTRPGCGHGR